MKREVADVMTRDVHWLPPQASLLDAARAMGELDVGVMPVCDDAGHVVGMLTDRDIVVRAVADNLPAELTPLSDVMSGGVRCCYADDPLAQVVEQMALVQIRRLPVLDRQQKLVGMLSLGDLATRGAAARAALALAEISEPAAPDRRLVA